MPTEHEVWAEMPTEPVCELAGSEKVASLMEMASCLNKHRPGYMADMWEAMDLRSICELRGCKLDMHYEAVFNDYMALLEEHIDEEENPCKT